VGGETCGNEALTKMGRSGGYDSNARLVDIDADDIDAAVLYPTAVLSRIEEADLFGAACRAYNRWLHDDCSGLRGGFPEWVSFPSKATSQPSPSCAAACRTSASNP